MENKLKLGAKEKFAYGIGAVGKDMVYMLSASYILYYYQDICGVQAWIMGVILLIARVFDAFNDPIMGVLVAKTKTKWGKFRPWLLIGTLTNAVVLYFLFAAPPSLDGAGLTAYAAILYILWGVTYTMMDIPYWSMVPAFTEGGKERENLSALARSCAGVGSALITVITVMSVAALGSSINDKSNDNRAVSFNNENSAIVMYVLEKDNDGLATGNVTELKDNAINVEFKAPETVLKDKIYATQDNMKYEVNVSGKVFTADNSSLTFATDDINGNNVALALYLSEKDYASLDMTALSVDAKLVSTNEVERVGFKYFSLIIAVLFFVFILITCTFIKEKSTVDVDSPSVAEMFRALLQNDQAMVMVLTIVLVNTSIYLTSNLMIYFFKYDLSGRNWQGDFTMFNIFGGACQIFAMMVFPLLRKLFDTIKLFYISVGSAVIGYAILLVMALGGVGVVFPYFLPGFFVFAAAGILNVLVTVFLANTVDYGELANGRRDESVIFSMQTFVVKLASGISAWLASLVLQIFNIASEESTIEGSVVEYLTNNVDRIKNHVVDVISNNSVFGLRLCMTVGPMIVLIIAIMVFKKKYILNDAKLQEISAQLAAQKSQA